MMKRIFLAATLIALVSCQSEEVTSSSVPTTVSWAPRLTYASGTTVPKVDKVRLEITLADGKGTTLQQEVSWSQGKVVVDNIPSGVAFTAKVRGLLTDGSEVWNGTTNVQGGSGEIAINSQVSVAPSVGIDLSVDEGALTSPAAGTFPRVAVNGWPFADADIRVLYTTDGATPTMGGSSTQEYVGPFTLQGMGNLAIRAYRMGTVTNASASSAVLKYAYSGTNPSSCTVPTFMPVSGILGATGSVSVNTSGTSNCELRYRTDGADPTGTDPLWANGAIFLGSTTTHLKLRAIGTTAALGMSPVMEGSWLCPNCTQVTAVSISASGATDLEVSAGMGIGLGVQLTGATASQLVWTIVEGSTYASLVATGTTAQLSSQAAPAGTSGRGTVVVKAAIAGTDKFVLFNIGVVAGTGVSLTANGNTVVSVNAGGTAPLSVTVTGADPALVTWGIETGNALVVFESGATGGTVQMKANAAAVSGSATVRATLSGSGKSVLFTLNFGPGTVQQGTISASGPTSLNISSGGVLQLSTTVTGVDVSQVSWMVESGSTLVYFPSMTSGSVVQLQAYNITTPGVLGTATVRASLPSGASVLFNLTVNGAEPAKVDTVFTASGETALSTMAGNNAWLYTNLTGANSSDIVWTVDKASASVSVTPTGTMASVMTSRILANGKAIDTVVVRARLGTTTREIAFSLIISGGELLSFVPSGTTTLSLEAGGTLPLYTMVTGKASPVVTWTVVEGGGTVTPGASSTNATYSAPSQVTTATDVHVKGVLEGTSLVVNYFISVSVRPALEIVDSTGVVRDEFAPERRAAKYFQARRGSAATTAAWSVDLFPPGATWNLYVDGSGIRFKPNMTGAYRLIAQEGDGADTVTVKWPDPPSLAFGADTLLTVEQNDYAYMYPKVFPSDEPLTWKIAGSSEGTLTSGNFYDNGVYRPGAYYLASATMIDAPVDVSVSVAFTSDAGKMLTYRIRVFPRKIVVRGGSEAVAGSFTVLDTAQGFKLEAMRKGKPVANASWQYSVQPPENVGLPGTQEGGSLLFHPAAPGRYVLQVYADGMTSDVEILWGGAP